MQGFFTPFAPTTAMKTQWKTRKYENTLSDSWILDGNKTVL